MSDVNVVSIEGGLSPTVVTSNRVGNMTHIFPRGNLVGEESLDALRAAVEGSIAGNETQLIVDMVSVAMVNSKALELLLDMHHSLVKNGGWIKLTNAKPLIRDIFHATGVDRVIDIVNSFNIDKTDADKPLTPIPESIRLGELLVDRGLLTREKVEEAITLQQKTGKRLGHIVVAKGWVNEDVFLNTLAEQLAIPFIQIRLGLIDQEVFQQLDIEITKRLKVLPMFMVKGELTLATSDPQAIAGFREIEEKMHCKVRPVLVRKSEIIKTLGDVGSDSIHGVEMIDELDDDFEFIDTTPNDDYTGIDEMAAESPVVNMVNSIIQRAVRDKVSDIHIEPSQKKCRVRFRIDGLLYEVMTPRMDLHPALISRLKVMANLDIAERRMPQDGRIQVHTQGRSVDLRFSSLPGMHTPWATHSVPAPTRP